jgi:3',5'-cyclic AMP phosphodiesterase CpdA
MAAGRPIDPNFWALLSDIHISADPTKVARGINMTGHFQAVARELSALPKRPAGVFINGDCAFNSGEKADYAQVAALLEPLRQDEMSIHLALGNHDQRERFWEVLEKTAHRPLPDRQVALLKTPLANWFVLDSLETTLSTPGLLGQEQLDWLAKTLDANPDKPALIMVHHNPGVAGGNMGLKDTVAFFEVIRPRKQVKAYIYGHTHAWKVEQDSSGIHLINLPPVAYLFHEGDPAGWVQATLEEKGFRLELRCIDAAHKAHGQTWNLKWREG